MVEQVLKASKDRHGEHRFILQDSNIENDPFTRATFWQNKKARK